MKIVNSFVHHESTFILFWKPIHNSDLHNPKKRNTIHHQRANWLAHSSTTQDRLTPLRDKLRPLSWPCCTCTTWCTNSSRQWRRFLWPSPTSISPSPGSNTRQWGGYNWWGKIIKFNYFKPCFFFQWFLIFSSEVFSNSKTFFFMFCKSKFSIFLFKN